MKIRLIADGSAKWQRMIRRWGIAFLVGEDVLFDTFGDACVFAANVRRQKIDLSKVRHVVISHDDWDHIAGLWGVLEKHKDLTVYVVPHFSEELKERIRSFGVRLVETPSPMMIRDQVYTTGELAGGTARGTLYEQALIVREGERVSVITGCAHPKLSDILKTARDYCGQGVDLVMGGFHLKDMEPSCAVEVVESLPRFGVRRVVPLHCTGSLAVKEFRKFFVQNFCRMREGETIEV